MLFKLSVREQSLCLSSGHCACCNCVGAENIENVEVKCAQLQLGRPGTEATYPLLYLHSIWL